MGNFLATLFGHRNKRGYNMSKGFLWGEKERPPKLPYLDHRFLYVTTVV